MHQQPSVTTNKSRRTDEESKYKRPDGELGVPNLDGDYAHNERYDKDDSVPPLRDLGVFGHQPCVDIRLLAHGATGL